MPPPAESTVTTNKQEHENNIKPEKFNQTKLTRKIDRTLSFNNNNRTAAGVHSASIESRKASSCCFRKKKKTEEEKNNKNSTTLVRLHTYEGKRCIRRQGDAVRPTKNARTLLELTPSF
jgi:hypothetical protein